MKLDPKFFEGTGIATETLLRFHPAADRFPMTGDQEFDQLVENIGEMGLQNPIVCLDSQIPDGRHRYLACPKAGVAPTFIDYVGDDPVAYVHAVNVHRRHLTVEQKLDLVRGLLVESPERSDRVIANLAQVHHKTVGWARAEMEARGAGRHVESRVDSKGRVYPGRKGRLSPPVSTASAEVEDASSGWIADSVSAVRHGDILRNLNEFMGFLNPDKKRIASYPAAARAALTRRFHELLGVSIDDLRPISAVPVFEDGFCLGAQREVEPAKSLTSATDLTVVVTEPSAAPD